MKRVTLLVIFFSILFCSLNYIQGAVTHTVSFDRAKLKQWIEDDWNRFSYENTMPFGKVGEPEIPAISINLIIPSGQSVSSITINSDNKSLLSGIYTVYPTQPPIPTSISAKKPSWVESDSAIYSSLDYYPKEIVRVVSEGYFDGATRIVHLLVTPLQYSPMTGEILFYDQVTFTLNLVSGKDVPRLPERRLKRNQQIYDNILKNLVDNPKHISSYQQRPAQTKSLGKSAESQAGQLPSYEYVVITNNALKTSFNDFVTWKRRKGLDIGVVTVEDIYSIYDTDYQSGITDNAGAIRQYLTDVWLQGTVWVLLGGDETVVPIRYGDGEYYNNGNNTHYVIPADLYFAEFNGDWNVDHDTYENFDKIPAFPDHEGEPRYGERTEDAPEYDPEVFIGRLAVSTSEEVKIWTKKFLLYVINPNNGDYSYLTKALHTQADQMQWWDWDYSTEEDQSQADVLSDLLSGYFNSEIAKEDIGNKYCTTHNSPPTYPLASDVIAKVDEGFGLITFSNHGDPVEISVSTGEGYDEDSIYHCHCWEPWRSLRQCCDVNGEISGINYLSETNKYYVIYSISCDVGAFDYDCSWHPIIDRSYAEGFVEMENKGAVAFGGNTRYGWVSPSFYLEKLFFNNLLSGSKLGVAEAVSKSNYSGNYYGHYLSYSHHLFGDPEMDIWTDTPSQFANVSITDNGTSITVNSGVSGSDICVSSGNNGADYHLLATNKLEYTFTTTVRPLYITVTKHNYIPYTAVTGGTFTSNETWFGNMNVLSGCSFTSDASLTLLPGTQVLMNGYFNLAFLDNARLIAEGTEDSPIIFTSSNGTSPQSWKYLYIRTSNNVLSHCEVKYGNWAIFMNGYPSSGNVVENCNIHDNDQGIRMENNEVDVINCDIYDNRHNVVTMYNAEIDIEGTHIHDGGRDGIYCYSADLLNIYGSVIEDNGNGGTSTRNGIYSRYADVINIGKLSYPYWFGYNTIRNNYNIEVYSYYGNSQVEILYNSIHDDSGYELYNYSGNPAIEAIYCWWGEYPPNYSQFYGEVIFMWHMSRQPYWEGQTRSGGLSKAAIPLAVNNESPEERIIRLKNTITSNCRSENADTALTELFRLIRSDYVDNQYQERQNFYSLLSQVYNEAKNYSSGQRALQYMIVWKILENDKKSAIDLSQQGLTILDDPDRMGVFGNLVYLYAYTNQFEQAHKLLKQYTDQYKFDADGIEFITETVADMEDMYKKELAKSKGTTPPEIEPVDASVPEKFTLHSAFPNPFNPSTTICFDLPEQSRVSIAVYNILGKEVWTYKGGDAFFDTGLHSVIWSGVYNNGQSVSTGIYIVKVTGPRFSDYQKVLFLK